MCTYGFECKQGLVATQLSVLEALVIKIDVTIHPWYNAAETIHPWLHQHTCTVDSIQTTVYTCTVDSVQTTVYTCTVINKLIPSSVL